jgi:hypothetical protein
LETATTAKTTVEVLDGSHALAVVHTIAHGFVTPENMLAIMTAVFLLMIHAAYNTKIPATATIATMTVKVLDGAIAVALVRTNANGFVTTDKLLGTMIAVFLINKLSY